jgi:hypothetical protein
MNALRSRACALLTTSFAIGLGAASAARAGAQPAPAAQITFATPDAAVAALRAAVLIHDKAALGGIFGPQIRELLTGDEKQDKANSRKFAAAIDEGVKPVFDGDDKIVLEIGAGKWPFAIPLVKEGTAWRFDTAAGKEEIINRHIGKDELHAIGFCRAYIKTRNAGGEGPALKPFHGYLFRTLHPEGAAASSGFALTAYPEHWGKSGIMTFIVGPDEIVYRRDFGEKTASIMSVMTEYRPDGDWAPEKEPGVAEK